MIVKFDHLSYVAERKSKAKLCKRLGTPLFLEEELPNLQIKQQLMRNKCSNHDLYFYDRECPVEYIFYDKVTGQSQVELDGRTIYGAYYDEEKAIKFLEGIFGQKTSVEDGDIKCNMKGVLDKVDYWLILKKREQVIHSFLDDGGYGTATLVVNKNFRNIPVDGICTETESLVVNGKKLDICFTASESTNIIFEMIRPCK